MMYRSAVKAGFRSIAAHSSSTSKVPGRKQSWRGGLNVINGHLARNPSIRHRHGSAILVSCTYLDYQGSLAPASQTRRMILSTKPNADESGICFARYLGTTRLYSGRSDEKENTEHKHTASLGVGLNKNGKDNVENTKQQQGEPSVALESAQAERVQNKDSELHTSDRQQSPFERHGDSERKKECKAHYSKKQHKRLRGSRKTGINKTKIVEDYDRLQLLKEKLIRKLGKRWVTWESITDSLDNFPYYICESTRDVLLECAAARLKECKYSKFGESLPSSSHLILLHGQAGTEIYQEVLVRAVARQLQVPLLVLDSSCLTAKDLNDDAQAKGLLIEEEDNEEDEEEEEEDYQEEEDDDKEGCNVEWRANLRSTEEFRSKGLENMVFVHPVKILKIKDLKERPGKLLEAPRSPAKEEGRKPSVEAVEIDNNYWADELKKLVLTGREDELKKLGKKGDELKKFWHDLIIGDRVKFNGPRDTKTRIRSKLKIGQEGFVTSISDGLPWKVCVNFQTRQGAGETDEVFCDASELEKVNSNGSDEAWLSRFPELPIEALCKMVMYRNPVIVYFPDIQHWFGRAATAKERGAFLNKVGDLMRKVNGPVVFIASRIKEDSGPVNPNDGLDTIFSSMIFEPTKTHSSDVDEVNLRGVDRIFKIFKNVVRVNPPEQPQLLQTWQKQLEEDKKIARTRRNHMLLEKFLAQHGMGCTDLGVVDALDLQLTRKSVEKVIGWSRNMCLHSNRIETNEGKLLLEKEWLEKSLLRLKAFKMTSEDKMAQFAGLAENDYEKTLMSSVVLAEDVRVKFEDIGALQDVKTTLKELIVLPMQRPELFKKGNLRKPCKGVLLFGPPGTGKTLLAKAVATEAGANFINVSASSITSKYYGDDEKLVKALFALARKLCPVVIFIDEVDSILGARGGSSEHEASRRIKNEFMACWDGLQSKENEQILVLATTNRPFDLDDAVIRRLPRRLLVDMPNVENREKILHILLANEDVADDFDFKVLALQCEGYSGSDLKNLCVAAAYVPIRELLEAEKQAQISASEGRETQFPTTIRPLCLEDFIKAKSKIGASVAFDAASMIQIRRWNEQYGEGGSRSQVVFGFSQ